jgi:hypothetical protein
MSDLTTKVFEHWRTAMGHERARMDISRQKVIRARLADGYTVEDLCLAVDGCAASAFHMGENEKGIRYDSLTLILRDADHVDKFIRAGEHAHRVVAERMAKRERDQEAAEQNKPMTEERRAEIRRMLAEVKLKKVA